MIDKDEKESTVYYWKVYKRIALFFWKFQYNIKCTYGQRGMLAEWVSDDGKTKFIKGLKDEYLIHMVD